jgi:AbrB family looped-hinge helix DNA binding protein
MNSYSESMKTVVSERGQITLPKEIRLSMGIHPGTVLEISIDGGKIIGFKKDAEDSIHKWRGKGRLPEGCKTSAEYLGMARE